jgi:hypothetical protein
VTVTATGSLTVTVGPPGAAAITLDVTTSNEAKTLHAVFDRRGDRIMELRIFDFISLPFVFFAAELGRVGAEYKPAPLLTSVKSSDAERN